MAVQEGDILDGRFELGRVAATGGMGVVFRGLDRQTGALVAVKTLKGTEGAERFRREVQVLSGLHHPGIVSFLGHGQARDELYLVMEWLEGEDLGSRLAAAEVSLDDAVGVGLQLASALGAAHAQGIVHRDLKPSNVFLCDWRLDRVKLLDYGIARLAGASALTETGAVVGTPAYMAPEQARGERTLDARADVYALGALLFHCLTGRPPFEAETLHGLLMSVLQRPAPRLGERLAVPPALDELVSRMLDKDPRRRPQDGQAVLRELSGLGRGAELALSVTAIAPPSSPGLGESVTTPRNVLSSVAVLPFHDMSASRDQGYLCEGIAEELINTLTALAGLRVTARSSSFALGGTELDARTIGQRLGVDAVLEGGVRKSGDRLRITVQLVDVAGGSPRWSHRFDGSLDQMFEIQDQIAASVATALRGMLSTEEREALRRPEAQVEAYEHFLRGRQLLHRQTGLSLEAAEREFLRATEIDPSYAPAYSGLAQVYMWYVDWLGRGEPASEAADRASRRALELGPQLAESHVARGAYLTSVCDYAGAERAYREAIRLNPRSFEAHYLLARCGVHGGKFDLAAEMFERAAELRPEDFQCCAIAEVPLNRLGRFEEAARNRREAIRRIERHLTLDPRDPRALILGAIIHVAEGRRALGFEWAKRALAEGPDDPATLINAGCMYARAGMTEEALACLEKSFGRGWGKRDWVNNDPDYDSLRDDPRFQALVAKLR
ncbi:MAG TPA: protein kinase [Myxococcaceae bacterium]|nr:protein kinase [Myxococcaceae bacterium]